MDGTNANAIEKVTEKKTNWTKRINKNVEIWPINDEKENLIERLEKVLNFLKSTQINNEEHLVHIKKPVDELQSYLKYIPNGRLFNDTFPMEIKEHILNYLCESKAFIAASVCQEWKKILEKRFKEEEVVIGDECFINCDMRGHTVKPADMLKAVAVHKLGVHLFLREPIPEVDSNLIADGLTSVSKFTVVKNKLWANPTLSDDQLEHLFESIEKGDKIMEEVKLIHLDLKGLNQQRLANCFVNKIKRLTLDSYNRTPEEFVMPMLDGETFINKLLQNPNNFKLTHLTLHFLYVFDGLSAQKVADALCNVENVKLCSKIPDTSEVMDRLTKNILQMSIVMTTLDIVEIFEDDLSDFGSLISTQNLKSLFIKMANIKLDGLFTSEQLKAVIFVPDVEVSSLKSCDGEIFHSINKGSNEKF